MATEFSLSRDGNVDLSDHFKVREFQSYCDDWGRVTTDDVLIDIKLVALLEKIFNKLFCSSIIITSGYRDYEFEMYLAGFCGYHNKGMAADIVCYDQNKQPIPSTEVCCAAQDCGANGIGLIGSYSVHVDVRDGHWWGVEDTGEDVEDWYIYAGKSLHTGTVESQMATDYGKVIDVSFAQGQIDWDAVKSSGIAGAIIRCGYGDDLTEQDDEYWTYNISEAERVSIPHGVYLYTYADTWEHARSEIAHLKRLLAGRKLQLPVYIDIEDPSILDTMNIEIFKWMGEQIEAMGYWCGMYASASVFRDRLGDKLDHFTRWVAQYNDVFESYGDMWQYTDCGSCAGISGGVDMSVMYRDIIGQIAGDAECCESAADQAPTAAKNATVDSNLELAQKIVALANKIK